MDKRGFTLLELLIVIVIIGILASIGLPRYFSAIAKARRAEAVSTLGSLRKVQQAYFSVYGYYTPVTAGDSSFGVDMDDISGNELEIVFPTGGYYTYSAVGTTDTAYGLAESADTDDYKMIHATGEVTTQ